MVNCQTCGDNEFDCIEGHFYCKTCQTQSQHAVEQEQEEDFIAVPTQIIRAPAKKDETKKEPVKLDYGRPWMTHEGFTIIIREQVKALIKMGASPFLKDIVMRMWTLYLRQAGAAFRNPGDTEGGLPMSLRRARDRVLATSDHAFVAQIRRRATMREKQKPLFRKKKAIQAQLKTELESAFEGEEFYDEDNPLDEEEVDSTSREDIMTEILMDKDDKTKSTETAEEESPVSQTGKKAKRIGAGQKSNPLFTRLGHTVSFCYLGLLYTNNLVTPGDLRRWIQDGRLPWSNASKIFPTDMKLMREDYSVFCFPDPPNVMEITRMAGRLMDLLHLDDFPVVDLARLTSRYVMELGLPGDLHALVRNLIRMNPIYLSIKSRVKAPNIPDFASCAMSHVIILLKLIFGLDDHTELAQMEYARELSAAVDIGQPLFIWDDWVCLIEQRLARARGKQLPRSYGDVRTLYNMEAVMEQYEAGAAHSAKTSQTRTLRKRTYNKAKWDTTKQSLLRPFTMLLDKVNGVTRSTSWRASEPATGEDSNSNSNDSLETGTLEYDAASGGGDDRARGRGTVPGGPSAEAHTEATTPADFTGHTVRYITEEEGFLGGLENAGLSDYTRYSSCVDSDSDGDSLSWDGVPRRLSPDEDSDSTFDPSQDMFTSTQQAAPSLPPSSSSSAAASSSKRKRKYKSAATEAVHIRLQHSSRQAAKRKRRSTQQNLAEIRQKLCVAYEAYSLYRSEGLGEARRHRAYEWLLQVCSQHIEVSVDTLHTFVQRLENIYLIAQEDRNAKVGQVVPAWLCFSRRDRAGN